MTEGDLLSAICASPDDDAPRLVLADLLSQRGDPRGEFIVVSCALAKSPNNHDLKARHDVLLNQHREEWCATVGLSPATTSFARGLIDSAVIGFTDAPAPLLDRLFAATPLTRLSMHSGFAADQLIEVFSRTTPQSLRVLNTPLWGPLDAEAFVNSAPFTRRLTTLLLSLEREVDLPMLTLAKAPSLAKLDTLSLTAYQISRPALEVFSSSRHLRLESLWFIDCEQGDRLAIALAGGASFGRLDLLDLTNNRLTDEGALALANSPNFPRLKTLRALQNDFTDRGHEALRARFPEATTRSKSTRPPRLT